MRTKYMTAFFLSLLFIELILFAITPEEKLDQEINRLSPKYKAFLKETQLIMTPLEKKVFLKLETDEDRDVFIEKFWKAREDRGFKTNIRTLMFLRMVQVLDLTESQLAKIIPKMNQIEREKRELNSQIGRQMRELRALLKEGSPDPQEIQSSMDELKRLRNFLKGKDDELESFLKEHLSLIQQAKHLIFSVDFYRGLRDRLDRAKRMQKK